MIILIIVLYIIVVICAIKIIEIDQKIKDIKK